MWLSHFASSTMWYYTNLTIYEFSCKCHMQLNRNSSHKPRTYLPIFFFILTYYYMVFKMALFLVLEKRKVFFIFSCKIF